MSSTLSLSRAKGSSFFAIIMLVLWALSTMFWWGLAFYPLSTTTPEWLSRAQAVCFGTMPNGMPAGYGWILLGLGPLTALVAFLVCYSEEITVFKENLKSSLISQFLLAVLAAAFVWELQWVGGRIYTSYQVAQVSFSPTNLDEALPEEYPRTANPAPQFQLVDQAGLKVSLEQFAGKVVILTFAFAHCQTVCPMLVQDTVAALKELPPERVQALFITLDPWRDTPQALPSLAEKWSLPEQARVLSGPVKAVTTALDAYKIPWKRNEQTGEVSHPALIYLLDPKMQIAYTFNNPPIHWLVEAANRMLVNN